MSFDSESGVTATSGQVGSSGTAYLFSDGRFSFAAADVNFSVNVAQNGVNAAIGPLFDPGFNANVGPNGAVLLAEVNFDIVGVGDAILNLSLGVQGFLQFPGLPNPSLGSGVIVGVAAIPEPSALALLMLGSVGLVARRKRS